MRRGQHRQHLLAQGQVKIEALAGKVFVHVVLLREHDITKNLRMEWRASRRMSACHKAHSGGQTSRKPYRAIEDDAGRTQGAGQDRPYCCNVRDKSLFQQPALHGQRVLLGLPARAETRMHNGLSKAGERAAVLVVLGQERVLHSWLKVQRVPKCVRERSAQRGFTRADVACARTSFKHEAQNTAGQAIHAHNAGKIA